MVEHDYISFFTATILEWKHLLKPNKYKQLLVDSLKFLVTNKRVKVYGFVIMPNHLHLLWKIEPPFLLEEVQRDFLKYCAQQIKYDLIVYHPAVLSRFYVGAKDRQYQFWERNPLTVYCYTLAQTEQKLDYIHRNPVQEKWKLATLSEEYPFSSACFYHTNQDTFGFLTHYRD